MNSPRSLQGSRAVHRGEGGRWDLSGFLSLLADGNASILYNLLHMTGKGALCDYVP